MCIIHVPVHENTIVQKIGYMFVSVQFTLVLCLSVLIGCCCCSCVIIDTCIFITIARSFTVSVDESGLEPGAHYGEVSKITHLFVCLFVYL